MRWIFINKTIIKTSKQAELEQEIYNNESTCPECNYSPNLYIYHYEGGLFKKNAKVKTYICGNCKCEWEVREYEK